MAYEQHPEDVRSLVGLATSRIEHETVLGLVRDVDAAVGAAASEFRDTSLVMSGAALGVEEVQGTALHLVNTHARLLGDTLRELDRGIADAAGDAEMIAFLTEVAQPIRKAIQDAVGYNVRAVADIAAMQYGIPANLVVAREATDEELSALDATASLLQPGMYNGFMSTRPEPGDNVKPRDLTLIGATAAPIPRLYIAECKAHYGSLENTAKAFTVYLLHDAWDTIKKIESAYSPAAEADPEEAKEHFKTLMSRMAKPQTGE